MGIACHTCLFREEKTIKHCIDTEREVSIVKKLAEVLEKGIFGIFALVYVGILLIDLIFQYVDFYRRKEFRIWNIGIIVIWMVGIAGFYWLYRKKRAGLFRKDRNWDRLIFIFSFLLFLIQVFICYHIYFMTGWDSGIITANADYVANGQTSELWNWYYSRCPNNSLLTAVYAAIFWVAEHVGVPSTAVRLLIVFGQCAISSWTGYLLYRCAGNMIKGITAPLMVWSVYAVLIGLSPWLIIPYSDSSCLFFPILLLWMYQTLEQGKAKYIKCVLMGILAYLGYEMKPMVIIVLIAILGIELLENGKERADMKKWSAVLVICASLVGTVGVCKLVNLEKIMGFEINQEARFGLTHYLMMGLNEEHSGVFKIEDADYSESIPTLEERKQENIRVALERVKNYGVVGLAKFMVKKCMVNFNDGTFAWGQEGDFYGIPLEIPDNPFKSLLRGLYYDDGKYHVVYETVAQFLWMLVLLGVALNSIRLFQKEKQMEKTYLVAVTSLIGITMFVMLFEARSRYLYTFVPLFILIAGKGYQELYGWMKRKQEKYEKKIEVES